MHLFKIEDPEIAEIKTTDLHFNCLDLAAQGHDIWFLGKYSIHITVGDIEYYRRTSMFFTKYCESWMALQ